MDLCVDILYVAEMCTILKTTLGSLFYSSTEQQDLSTSISQFTSSLRCYILLTEQTSISKVNFLERFVFYSDKKTR